MDRDEFRAAAEAAEGSCNVGEPTDDDGKPPKHISLVDAMIQKGFVLVDGVPCVPGEHGFEFGWDTVHRAMLDYDPWSVDRTRNEAIKTLRYQGREERAANHRYIGFNNCVLDIHTMKHITNEEFAKSGRGIIPVTIPHEYDPDAQPCEAVETLLDGISCGERDVRLNLEETIGLCLSRYTDDRSRAVWLYGRGQNGKSTYWQALSFVVGEHNTCSLCLDDLSGKFNTQMLVGKLLSVSDDEVSNSVSKSVIGTIKKIVTGQPIRIEPKGKDPYNATMFCTMIVTSNEPPQLADTTHGSLRRWHMIPLNADFSEGGRDIDLNEKLHTEQAAQWLIKLGIDGLKRILANEGMTENQYSLEAVKDARERSNSVFAFLADHPRREFLEDRNVETWYWRYQAEAKNSGSRPFEQAKFSQMVCDEYGFDTANNGRYKNGEWHVGYNDLARDHGRKAGDKYRVFVEKKP